MADPNTRQGKRTPVTLKIKFKSETLEQFIERYAVDVSQGGIFIRTKEPLAVGTQMKFEFQLKDASPLIAGEGTVVWTRENDPSRPAIAPGMGVRFDRLADGSQQVLERILAEKMKQAPARTSGESTTKPPMFTDTPTRVAPAPVQDALLGDRSRRDSEQTPLPNPMPFHSDAEDFDEKAFEEATKVRALDELVAATAASDAAETAQVTLPNDELAARRHGRPETPLAEPPTAELKSRDTAQPDRDSAPGLPSPPEARPHKHLDTTPSPRSAPMGDDPARTKLGLEPAKAPTGGQATVPQQQRREAQDRSAVPRPVTPASEPSRPVVPNKPSSAPIVIAILVVVAAALAGVWYFVLRDNVAEDTGTAKGSGSAAVAHNPTPPPPQTGSGSAQAMTGSGSAHAMTGSAGSGSAGVKPPSGPTVDTIIAASVPNANIEVTGTGLSGPAPYTAKLEKGQTYEVNVTAAGFAPKKVFVTGGQDKATIKLDPKPHVITVTSEPAGAQIFIENVQTAKVTPADIELSGAQGTKGKVKVGLRKPGFRPVDQTVDSFTDEDTKVTAKVDVKLSAMPVIRPNGGNGNTGGGNGGNTSGSAAGSAATPATGSATPPAGSATPPAGSASPTEPEPDFNKRQ